MTNTNTQIIYSDIKQELNILFKIAPLNKNLETLKDATDYFQDNKDALLIIRSGLRNINSSLTEINEDWKNGLSEVINNILISVKDK